MIRSKTFEITRLIFPYDYYAKRVSSFRRWRELVNSDPKRYRISMFQIPSTSSRVGGIAFSLEELVVANSHRQVLYQPDVTKIELVIGDVKYFSKTPFESWTIVEHTDLWPIS